MILSHKHKFIFIKTNKTAGTSVEIALSKYCGPEDVITPISRKDEALRQKLGYPGAQNFAVPLRTGVQHYLRYRKWPRYYNHMSAVEVRRLVGEKIWTEYFTFCFERNPWDRAISLFHWRNRNTEGTDPHEFIQNGGLDRLKRKGSQLYVADGEVLVDQVYLYERLDDELEQIAARLGLSGSLVAPRTKENVRPSRKEVRLTLQDIEHIARQFSFEIGRYNYRFEGTLTEQPPSTGGRSARPEQSVRVEGSEDHQ